MALISKKKVPFKVSDNLRVYLKKYNRNVPFPIKYEDLLRYNNSIPLYNNKGEDTLWVTTLYPQVEMENIHKSLKKNYALLTSDGDMSVIEHLFIDRVDLCVYGNTQPFRIRVVNRINDNFDYFYIKNADASRIYGLELEHLLSPNRINYFVYDDTLMEEHIIGIPADQFIATRLDDGHLNEIRLAKEFVKFNERCFVRLLGDMHSSNFVINITPDFEEVSYRLRPIDFDQQSYEGSKSIYLPQYFKQNNPIIELGLKNMTPATVKQYQREERSLIANRVKIASQRVTSLIDTMKKDRISTDENVNRLRKDLSDFYEDQDFLKCKNMGEILELSLNMLERKPELYKLP